MVGLERFELIPTGGLSDEKPKSNKSGESEVSSGGAAPECPPCPDLARISKAWGKLPQGLRAAILAIVATVDDASTKGGRS